jgi:hypothetical protein
MLIRASIRLRWNSLRTDRIFEPSTACSRQNGPLPFALRRWLEFNLIERGLLPADSNLRSADHLCGGGVVRAGPTFFGRRRIRGLCRLMGSIGAALDFRSHQFCTTDGNHRGVRPMQIAGGSSSRSIARR